MDKKAAPISEAFGIRQWLGLGKQPDPASNGKRKGKAAPARASEAKRHPGASDCTRNEPPTN